jgi:hypothetical protein
LGLSPGLPHAAGGVAAEALRFTLAFRVGVVFRPMPGLCEGVLLVVGFRPRLGCLVLGAMI